MHQKIFTAKLNKIGINPFVFIPDEILARIFSEAACEKSPIPVSGMINGTPFLQTLIKYKGEWRLYINTKMLKDSPKRVEEQITVSVGFDPRDRTIPTNAFLTKSLHNNPEAERIFYRMNPSARKEISGYIDRLKTEESREKNIIRVLDFLQGKGPFLGKVISDYKLKR